MSTATEERADLTAACDTCGKTVVVSQDFITKRQKMQKLLDREALDSAALVRVALVDANWILFDEHENHVRTWAKCVERTKVERAKRECPPWCATDHAAETHTNEWSFCHMLDGGIVRTYSPVTEIVVVLPDWDINLALDDHEGRTEAAKELRDLAADLLKSAEWLEGDQ